MLSPRTLGFTPNKCKPKLQAHASPRADLAYGVSYSLCVCQNVPALLQKNMKRALQALTGSSSVNDRLLHALGSVTKMFVGELVATGIHRGVCGVRGIACIDAAAISRQKRCGRRAGCHNAASQ